LAVKVTGRVQIGRFVLEIGAPAGTRAVVAPETAGADPAELAVALGQPGPTDGLVAAEESLGEAASVTGRVERALELFTAVAQGRADRKVVLQEVDVLLGALERLDREGRYDDVFRLARALTGLLALLMRWVALVQAVRIALKAARALGDSAGEAWARHELGTLSLGAEDAQAANGHLEEALRLRNQLGDKAGAEVTKHNLAVLHQAFGFEHRSFWSRPVVAAAVVAGVVVLGAAGVGVATLLRDDGPPPLDTIAPVVSFDEVPENPTQERSASFAFSADEDVRKFECRLDKDAFKTCSNPYNIAGPLEFGAHVFVVRAIDFADNTGDPARHRWTVERGEGPQATIVEGPDALTNETTAEFTIEAPGAIRLECRVDDNDFESCPTLVTRAVEEGDHIFVVRALDADGTAGAPAEYRWTVDTTPPTVEIDSAVRTGLETAEVTFTPGESESRIECVLLKSSKGTEPVEVQRVAECSSPTVFEGLEGGTPYLVQVRATDAAGNVGPADEADIPGSPPIL
jgi:tetratricopeptide (TPR) repeat protein